MKRIIILLCLLTPALSLQAQEGQEITKPCSAPEADQFDFWIGKWDLTWGEDGKGTNVVTREMNGCVIRENFEDPVSPFRGMSVSVYHPTRKKWLQTWVDDSGGYLDFEGGFKDGKMTLSRTAALPDGTKRRQRMVFYNIDPNALDWDWETSEDGGKTWNLKWRIHYQRQGS